MKHTKEHYLPKGKLVPIFCANESQDVKALTLSLSKHTAARGEKVCVIDCLSGTLMADAGIIFQKTLANVLCDGADLKDAIYVTSNEHFTMMAAGEIEPEHILGSLAAFSLDYDWLYVAMPSGCTPVHVRLAGAADETLLCYVNEADQFMRAYWMVDAIRKRHPKFDPCLVSTGPHTDSENIANTLRETVRGFLGAPPTYIGHETDAHLNQSLIAHMDSDNASIQVA